MKPINKKQKKDILAILEILGLGGDKAKIISLVTNNITTSIDKLDYYEASIIINALSELLENPDKKQCLIDEIKNMAPLISTHFSFFTGDPITNCFTIIGMRIKSLDACHYIKIHKAHNLLLQLHDGIIAVADIEVSELLDELKITTTN